MAQQKPFDQSLHDRCDGEAKRKIIRWLFKKGFRAKENPDRYGIDVIAVMGLDVEVKMGWDEDKFPFKDLQIPVRKKKFVKPGNYFCVLNKDRTRMALVDSNEWEEVREVKNKYEPDGGGFLVYPRESLKFFDLT